MRALFEAARPDARIILLGDRDQLASVEAGYVLGDICRSAGLPADDEACSESFAAYVSALGGVNLPASDAVHPMRDHAVELRKNFRFGDDSAIAQTAMEVRAGDADAIGKSTGKDLSWEELPKRSHELVESIAKAVLAVRKAKSPAAALEQHSAIKILCAIRRGPWGVEGMNQAVESYLREHGHGLNTPYYQGRPILVTSNDHTLGLYNGDVGVCWDGHVHFAGPDGTTRAIAPARLPPHETAWAMTVHKSQGSEFNDILLVIPDADNPVLSRELVYTAITRAKQTARVVGPEDVLKKSVQRSAIRASGLSEMLAVQT